MAPIDLDAVLARHGLKRADLAALGLNSRAIDYWRSGDRKISIPAAQTISTQLGIPLHELRPDIWPPPAKPPAKASRRREAVAA